MSKKPVFALFVLLMLAVVMIPAMPVSAWEYQDGTPSDTKFENFGPRADKVLIKLYASELAEFDALGAGEIDITDWPLTKTYYDLYTVPPGSDKINVIFYGDQFGIFLLDINNNNNQYLGNPPNPAYPNPVYPNPTSVVEMRQAIAHLCDRAQFDTIMGEGFYAPLYTTHGPSYGAFSHPEIRPGGALEALTYPYNRTAAEAKLDAGHFPIGADGWRYWDLPPYNPSGPRGTEDLDLELKFAIRGEIQPRRDFGVFLKDELEAVKVHVTCTFWSSWIQLPRKDFHLYTGGWGLGVDPTHCILANWDYYWHPGRPHNYAGINDALLNQYSYGVMYADTEAEALTNCLLFQERFAEIAASVPLFTYAGSKAMSRYYTGGNAMQPVGDGEDAYRGQYWNGTVNVGGFGIDSFFSFLNMHPQGFDKGTGDMTIRYGYKVSDIKSHNPVYAQWLWDWNTFSLQLDSLLVRNPYDLPGYEPWLAESYEIGTYTHPVYGTCTKVRFTLRPDATWHDGTPITVADVFFTLVELDDILAARGLPPPWWISNVRNILSFSILDPYNFEVLLDIRSIWAAGWIGGNLILPKHIWKPLAEGGDIESNQPDPNCILSGPYRFAEYVEYSHVLLVANKPGSVVTTDIPGSTPITSPNGYFRVHPFEAKNSISTIGYEGRTKVPDDVELRWDHTFQNLMDNNTEINTTLQILAPDLTTYFRWSSGYVPVDAKKYAPEIGMIIRARHVYIVLSLVKYVDLEGGWERLIYVKVGLIFHTTGIMVEVDGDPVGGTAQTGWQFIQIKREMTIHDTLSLEHDQWFLHDLEITWHTRTDDISGSTWFNDVNGYIGSRLPTQAQLALTLPPSSLWGQLPSPDIKVDIKDVALAAKAFGSYPGHERWNAVADVNGDYKIDIKDIAAVAKTFGWVPPPDPPIPAPPSMPMPLP